MEGIAADTWSAKVNRVCRMKTLGRKQALVVLTECKAEGHTMLKDREADKGWC